MLFYSHRLSKKCNEYKTLKPHTNRTLFSIFSGSVDSQKPKSETSLKDTRKCFCLVLRKPLCPRLNFFHSIGISSSDLPKMFAICQGLFTRSLENRLIPNFNTLSNLLQSIEKTIVLIKFFPYIVFHDVEYYLIPNVKILPDIGVSESNIVKSIYSLTRLFHAATKNVEKNVAVVKEMGIDPLSSQFISAIKAKVAKNPWSMILSIDKIMAAMDIFVNQKGGESSFIAKRSRLILLSMEKRIVPRVAVIQFPLSKGLSLTELICRAKF